MNRYLFLHRVRWPLMLVVFGVTALLNQWGILSWGESWPLYLIALGLLQLAERAAWSQAQMQMPPMGGWGVPAAGPTPGSVPGSTTYNVPPPPPGTTFGGQGVGPGSGPQDGGRR
jgi:hypothetical protein